MQPNHFVMGFKVKLFDKTVLEINRGNQSPVVSAHPAEEQRSSLKEPPDWLIKAFGGYSRTGLVVSEETALNFSAVFRAVAITASTIASLPLHLYTKSAGGRVKLPDHPAALLLQRPSVDQTGFVWRETQQSTLSLWGNAYAVIHRAANGRPGELEFIHPRGAVVEKINRRLYYSFPGTYSGTFMASDVLHLPGLSFDGVKGKSVISAMREAVGLGLAAQDFGATFFGNGANMEGVLESPGKLDQDVYDRLKNSWAEKHQGLDNAHKPAILEGGMKYTRIGIPPEDAQFLETRKFQVTEIARYFGVAPHLLFDLERSTNNNIEAQGTEFVIYTLLQWTKRWEEELNLKLLTTDEQKTNYFRHDLRGLMRADSAARGQYYSQMISSGVMSPNQVAELEELQAFEGGDQHFMQSAFAPIETLKDFYTKKSE